MELICVNTKRECREEAVGGPQGGLWEVKGAGVPESLNICCGY